MSNARIWIFRFLILIGIVGLVISFAILPWWSLAIDMVPGLEWPLSIHPYGLDDSAIWELMRSLPQGGAEADMPFWFTPAMWLYFGIVSLALLAAIWFASKNKQIGLLGKKFSLTSFLLFGVGVSYVVVMLAFYLVASARLAAVGIGFLGETYVELGSYAVWDIATTTFGALRFGFWLAAGTALFILILAFLRNIIVGRQEV